MTEETRSYVALIATTFPVSRRFDFCYGFRPRFPESNPLAPPGEASICRVERMALSGYTSLPELGHPYGLHRVSKLNETRVSRPNSYGRYVRARRGLSEVPIPRRLSRISRPSFDRRLQHFQRILALPSSGPPSIGNLVSTVARLRLARFQKTLERGPSPSRRICAALRGGSGPRRGAHGPSPGDPTAVPGCRT
jgi:hypothetical protein